MRKFDINEVGASISKQACSALIGMHPTLFVILSVLLPARERQLV